MRKYAAAPHPFIFIPDPDQQEWGKPGEPLFFDLVLVGKANQHLPYIIHSMQQAGRQGMGRLRGKFGLIEVKQRNKSNWETIYLTGQPIVARPPAFISIPAIPKIDKLALTFETPFRAQQQGRIIQAQDFRFEHFLSPLMRRLFMLSYFHTDTSLEIDFKGLTEQAKRVELLGQDLRWHNWNRYSSRQQGKIEMGGVVGRLC